MDHEHNKYILHKLKSNMLFPAIFIRDLYVTIYHIAFFFALPY